jgi:hypothetical protein
MIVCPLSVLSNWQKQIQDHVVNGGLTCYTYHGENKGVTATTLASYDVRLHSRIWLKPGGPVDIQYSGGGSPYFHHKHTVKGKEDEIHGWTVE